MYISYDAHWYITHLHSALKLAQVASLEWLQNLFSDAGCAIVILRAHSHLAFAQFQFGMHDVRKAHVFFKMHPENVVSHVPIGNDRRRVPTFPQPQNSRIFQEI